jgi:serine/threonine protein kinase
MNVVGGDRDDATLTTNGAADGRHPAAPPLQRSDPRNVGPYTVEGRLGSGGMGTVFLARNEEGRLVALKIIRPEYASDQRFLARFRSEVEAARRVARFCTAQVLDAGADGSVVYLVTEYIDGPTLDAEVRAAGRMSGSTLDGLAIGVAAALHGIHGAGVVHRDLKPSNVMLSRVGPKVIDFGVARALDGGETASGQILGTPGYMAPEQFRTSQSTPASDVFAWGAVVTFAGTGRAPFGSGTPYLLMRRVLEDEPDLTGLDGHLAELVRTAMHKDPALRPSSYDLLLELVGRGQDPIHATTAALRAAWTEDRQGSTKVTPPTVDADGLGPDAPTRRSSRRRRARNVTTGLLVGLLAAVLLAQAAPNKDPGRPGGSGPTSTPSPTKSADAGPGPAQTTAPAVVTSPGSAVTVNPGTRVPPTGFTDLGSGEVHLYRFDAAAGGTLYLEVRTETCAHLLPWRLTDPNGDEVFPQRELGCDTFGPVVLARAGTYELRVGGTAGGPYAFRLTIS